MQFIYPIDGDVLTPAEGILQGDLLWITVKLRAAGPVTVNNLPCRCNGEICECEVPLKNGRNALVACCNGEKCEIVVYRFQKAYMKYRLDNKPYIMGKNVFLDYVDALYQRYQDAEGCE